MHAYTLSGAFRAAFTALVGAGDAAAASTLLGEDAPSSLRLGTPGLRSVRDDDDFAAI